MRSDLSSSGRSADIWSSHSAQSSTALQANAGAQLWAPKRQATPTLHA